jgi:hypothetical protein
MPETIVGLTPDDPSCAGCCCATPATSTPSTAADYRDARRDSPPRRAHAARPAIADAFYREHGIALGG